MLNKTVLKTLSFGIGLVLILTMTQCTGKIAPALPKDILGISVGMNKENAEQRLREIGKFMRDEGSREQVWSLSNNPNFGYLAVGYDENNQVRYVTAITKPQDGQPVFFKDVGDLTTAKRDVAGPNHRYIWEVAASENNSGYLIIAQGVNAEFLSLYTLSRPNNPGQEKDKEKENE